MGGSACSNQSNEQYYSCIQTCGEQEGDCYDDCYYSELNCEGYCARTYYGDMYTDCAFDCDMSKYWECDPGCAVTYNVCKNNCAQLYPH